MTPRTNRFPFRRTLSTGLAIALALLAAGPGAAGKTTSSAKPTISKASASDSTVTVRGRVALPSDTAEQRGRTRVVLTLTDPAGKVERLAKARIDDRRFFSATRTTKLTGTLVLRAQTTVGGKASGKPAERRIRVTGAPPPAAGPFRGTFKLDPGDAPSGKPPTGSYFQMFNPSGAALENVSSPSANKSVTPLSPGTDGGLRTDAYQEPPSPAFSGGDSGHALAGRIVEPVPFYGTRFSIVTAPVDPQLGVPDPLPAITRDGDKLGGQLSAWVAQWNGQSFNQGSPKPDGSMPPPTTPLSGTYDAATGRFTLAWKSLIVGGPFNGFTGSWRLEGTFVPAG